MSYSWTFTVKFYLPGCAKYFLHEWHHDDCPYHRSQVDYKRSHYVLVIARQLVGFNFSFIVACTYREMYKKSILYHDRQSNYTIDENRKKVLSK